MTSKTFADQEDSLAVITATGTQGTSFTWQNLAGHWLRSASERDHDIDAVARRQVAVQRWRGLIPENTTRL